MYFTFPILHSWFLLESTTSSKCSRLSWTPHYFALIFGEYSKNPLKFRFWIPKLSPPGDLKCLKFGSNWSDDRKTGYSRTHSLSSWLSPWRGPHAAWIAWSYGTRTTGPQKKMKLARPDARCREDVHTWKWSRRWETIGLVNKSGREWTWRGGCWSS